MGIGRAVIAGSLAFALSAVAEPLGAQGAADCQLARVEGTVALLRGGNRAEAVTGQALRTGDGLSTGAGARATILCTDGLRVVIGPGTTIGLDRLMTTAAADGWPGVDLFGGLMGVIRPRGGGGFAVRTPSAVAAVRSTEWTVAVEDRATAAFVREGRVSVVAGNGSVVLNAGEGVDVGADGQAGDPVAWGAARVAEQARRLGPDWAAP